MEESTSKIIDQASMATSQEKDIGGGAGDGDTGGKGGLAIEQLQEQLQEALARGSALEAQLAAAEIVRSGNCTFLDKFPLEVRNLIYENLLTNEDISKPKSLAENVLKLGLHPAILRVNKQVFKEALDVLYGRNNFLVECVNLGYLGDGPNLMSVVTRQINGRGKVYGYSRFATVYDTNLVTNIKHWTVMISAFKHTSFEAPNYDFVEFCRMISTSKPLSLTVLVLPEGLEKMDQTFADWSPETDGYHALDDILSPLKLIRGVGQFSLRHATVEELPDPFCYRTNHPDIPPTWGTMTNGSELDMLPGIHEGIYKAIVTSSVPLEHAFKMKKNLSAYAQAFERCKEFKLDMDLPYGHAKHDIQDRLRNPLISKTKPYKGGEVYHPVEEGLERCAAYADENDVAHFKEFRRAVLTHLQVDYERISAAASALNSFVKYHKSQCGIFDPKPHRLPFESCRRRDAEWNDYHRGLILLEDYVKSFDRSVTPEVALEIRKFKRAFEVRYSQMDREKWMVELDLIHERVMLRTGIPNFDQFVELFKKVVDDCDSQYLEIRAARKALFRHDLTDTLQGSFSTESHLCDEMVNWSLEEPEYEVKRPDPPASDDNAVNIPVLAAPGGFPIPPLLPAGNLFLPMNPANAGMMNAVNGALANIFGPGALMPVMVPVAPAAPAGPAVPAGPAAPAAPAPVPAMPAVPAPATSGNEDGGEEDEGEGEGEAEGEAVTEDLE